MKALLKDLKEHSKNSLEILRTLRKESEIYSYLYETLVDISKIDRRRYYKELLTNIEQLNL